ncbi:MAG: substrate-binding domain-containing protein [Litoreibacter sp.]|uniref:substrate-binding domain-containing protein n=1 Tax=Litoreibacter sp. TaxID=1969459 RepID=UPI003299C14C
MIRTVLGALGMLLMASAAPAEDMKLAVTTSFHNSGLADILLPQIKADTEIDVQLLVVGTGQAIKLAEAGDVDAILVHSRTAEDKLVADGFSTHRREIMYNDFVYIGPNADPAKLAGGSSAIDAMRLIEAIQAPFVSRGDDSGTHKKELSLWAEAKLTPEGRWYNAVGAGMGAALNTAAGLNAYIIADRASWLNFGNKGDLALLFSGDPALFNQYAYLPVSPSKHDHVKAQLAEKLEAWLTSPTASKLINGYKINGEALFVFNAR